MVSSVAVFNKQTDEGLKSARTLEEQGISFPRKSQDPSLPTRLSSKVWWRRSKHAKVEGPGLKHGPQTSTRAAFCWWQSATGTDKVPGEVSNSMTTSSVHGGVTNITNYLLPLQLLDMLTDTWCVTASILQSLWGSSVCKGVRPNALGILI